jgi:crossover junction endodeoxyribonuclease RusA
MHYEIYLPFPPTVNNYYVKTQKGVFISNKGRKFRDLTAEAVLEQLPDVYITDKCLIEVVLFPPDKRIRDLGNYDKALLDALTKAGLWEDDNLVDQQFFYRGERVAGGVTFLRITDAGPLLKEGQTPPED